MIDGIEKHTRKFVSAPALAAFVLAGGFFEPAAAVESEGKFPKYAISLHSGGSFFSELEDDFSLEDPGFLVGMGAETWWNSQWAARARVRYSRSGLEFNDREIADVDIIPADVNVMYRPLSPKGSRRFVPFISAGIGAVRYDADDTAVEFDDDWETAGVISVGVDILPNTPSKVFGAFIRLELSDHIVFDSPMGNSDETIHNFSPTLGMSVIFPLQPASR